MNAPNPSGQQAPAWCSWLVGVKQPAKPPTHCVTHCLSCLVAVSVSMPKISRSLPLANGAIVVNPIAHLYPQWRALFVRQGHHQGRYCCLQLLAVKRLVQAGLRHLRKHHGRTFTRIHIGRIGKLAQVRRQQAVARHGARFVDVGWRQVAGQAPWAFYFHPVIKNPNVNVAVQSIVAVHLRVGVARFARETVATKYKRIQITGNQVYLVLGLLV